MAFYWFGDSWVYGDELEREVNNHDFKKYTFANLISEHFNQEPINLSVCGGSINGMVYEFSKVASQLTLEDTVFFLLTSDCRTSIYEQGQIKNILPGGYANKHNIHTYNNEWYKFFDSAEQRLLQYEQAINLVYFWCKHLKVNCWFANLFNTQPMGMFDSTDESNWLVPKTKCLGEFILPIVKNNTLVFNDCPELTNEEWKQQRPYVDQYIKPNYCHPNIAGHKTIANEIIKILENKQ